MDTAILTLTWAQHRFPWCTPKRVGIGFLIANELRGLLVAGELFKAFF